MANTVRTILQVLEHGRVNLERLLSGTVTGNGPSRVCEKKLLVLNAITINEKISRTNTETGSRQTVSTLNSVDESMAISRPNGQREDSDSLEHFDSGASEQWVAKMSERGSKADRPKDESKYERWKKRRYYEEKRMVEEGQLPTAQLPELGERGNAEGYQSAGTPSFCTSWKEIRASWQRSKTPRHHAVTWAR